ncbi:GNAT superfamily N-acetyltransferase [Amycolatopsis bartoniae]|uniref:N-acetyltransferase n=1 Tax=Amycolatopsis bartoniae TaxID=941986 RepID=A0A8H9MFC4_9PSEU|nr:GNAT family N-acetyltransferase [Amycolatopsis bartoniae]MBB2936321.1 GNAT superfamily N-acetyltransferase [Amycolatopsis bartoniae]TVS99798.1 GNAT family N-acetyltransferase [Amycolatopsis bartoniae]GHF85324.1 N-acetyltransferase [Amycolatopsis bartoniae]
MKWTVRRAVPADAGRIAEINIEGWRAAYRGLLPDSYLDGMRYETLRERWSTGLRSYTEPAAMFVAVGPDPVVRAYAFVSAARQETDRHPNLPTGELCAIYADPRWRGTGAGFAVHQAALGHLAAHGYRHAVLWVLAGNAPARRFYEARGWKCDDVLQDLPLGGEPIPEVRYSRGLQESRT